MRHKLNRREFLKSTGLTIGMLTMSGCTQSLLSNKGGQQLPNIVFILADDMGFGDLACQNPESKIPTPNLDRLAREGIRFTDAHSASSVCTPTRYSILTGRYCWRTPLKSSVLWPWDSPLIEPDRLTVGEMLKQHGYSTACIGKWHLGWQWPTVDGSRINDTIPLGKFPRKRAPFGRKIDYSQPIGGGPTTRGFDYYFGDDVPNFPPYCFIENDHTVGTPREDKPEHMFGLPGQMVKGWRLEAVMPTITQEAVDYILAPPHAQPFNKHPGRPFFLYFALTAPHTPIAPVESVKGKSKAGAYGDYVYQVDSTVGQIMRALDKSGQAENTLLIFTSDNGSPARDGTKMCGEPRSVRKYGHNPSYIYRGIKADIWDGGHHIPFIARWPRQIEPGSFCDGLIHLGDLMATCAAIIGHRLPNNSAEDSFNILPALVGRRRGKPIREAVIHHSGSGMFAVRQERWKLILGKGSGGWSGSGKDSDPPGQLYDMVDDACEKKNLYAERPDIVQRLTSLLDKYKREGRSAPVRGTGDEEKCKL